MNAPSSLTDRKQAKNAQVRTRTAASKSTNKQTPNVGKEKMIQSRSEKKMEKRYGLFNYDYHPQD